VSAAVLHLIALIANGMGVVIHRIQLQVLFLDSDSMPLNSPDDSFTSGLYRSNGNLFYPDLWKEGVHEARLLTAYEKNT